MKAQLSSLLLLILLIGEMRAQYCSETTIYKVGSSDCPSSKSKISCSACTSCSGGISKGVIAYEDRSVGETGCYSIFIIIGPVMGFLVLVAMICICRSFRKASKLMSERMAMVQQAQQARLNQVGAPQSQFASFPGHRPGFQGSQPAFHQPAFQQPGFNTHQPPMF